MEGFTTIILKERKIIIKGIGKLYFQEGFPIGMAVKLAKEKGYEVSWFHIIKEMEPQMNYNNDRLFALIMAEIQDAAVEEVKVNIEEIQEFIYGDIEKRRDLIYNYLWTNKEEADYFLRNQILQHVNGK